MLQMQESELGYPKEEEVVVEEDDEEQQLSDEEISSFERQEEGQDGSPGNAEEDHVDVSAEIQIQEEDNETDDGELLNQVAEQEIQQKAIHMHTGQSFGDIQKSSNREQRMQQMQQQLGDENANGMYQATFQPNQIEIEQQMLRDQMQQQQQYEGQAQGDENGDLLLQNWQRQQQQIYDGSPGTDSMDPNDYDENNDVEKEESFGTGSFTTNTFNARLASSNGMAILKYVQSEDFGKHGESIKLISNIQEFMNKLQQENSRLEDENAGMQKSNELYTGLTQANQSKVSQSVDKKHLVAREVTDLEAIFHRYDGAEGRFTRKEKNYKKDLQDLIEYVQWITDETSILRERIRKAEAVISSLRKSGESSVESLLKTMFALKKKQEKLDSEAELLRMHVKTKETMIKMKEDEKGHLKAKLEDEKKQQDHDFSKLRAQLDEQKKLIGNQRQLLNKLQVLNEVTQGAITQSSQDLAGKIREKQGLSIQISDKTRDQNKLKVRHNYLQSEIKNCIPSRAVDGQLVQRYHPDAVTILPDQHRQFNIPTGSYVDVNRRKIRSFNAMFSEKKNPINYNAIVEPREDAK